jgi:hypothetical protein
MEHWLILVRQKSQISNIEHNCTEDEKTQESWILARAPKKCAPCFRGTRNFLFIYFHVCRRKWRVI